MMILHRKMPPRNDIVIVIKEVLSGWEAYSLKIPELKVYGRDFDIVRESVLAQARKLAPGVRFIINPVRRNKPFKNAISESPPPPRRPTVSKYDWAILHLKAAGRLTTTIIRGEKIWILDGKIGAKIPDLITAAGFMA